MNSMTPLRQLISRLRELEKAAGAAPWDKIIGGSDCGRFWSAEGPCYDISKEEDLAGEDAALIAASRNALPKILDALENSMEALDIATEYLGRCRLNPHQAMSIEQWANEALAKIEGLGWLNER